MHVFISYSSKDHLRAFEICRMLEEHGIVCWIAPRNIPKGRPFSDAITEGIERAPAFVLLFSAAADESRWVRAETEIAMGARKSFYPVRIEPVSPSGGLKLHTGLWQWTEAWEEPTFPQSIASLASDIKRALESQAGAQPVVPPPHVERRTKIDMGHEAKLRELIEGAWIDEELTKAEETYLHRKGAEYGFERDYVARIIEELRPPCAAPPLDSGTKHDAAGAPPDHEIMLPAGPVLADALLQTHTPEPPPTSTAGSLRSDVRFIAIPAGTATFGCHAEAFQSASAYARSIGLDISALGEPSAHHETMPAFSIAETPITNAQYAEFAKATGWTLPSGWNTGDPAGWFPRDRWDHPVTRVSFADAEACAAWYGGRLPLAREWERAARGTDGRAYPWGNDFDPARCQSAERGAGGTASVTAHPSGRSPDGALDTVGNVSEWIDAGIGQYKSVRGGSYQDMCRVHGFPWASPIRAMADSSHPNVGFRIVKSDPASNAFDLRSVLKPEFRPIKLARSMIGCPPDLLSELRSKYPLADSLVDGLRKHGFRPVTLKPFWIERHAVTNLQYWYFVFETGRAYPDHWLAKPLRWLIDRVGPPTSDAWLRDGVPFLDKYAKHPVINVSMLDAQAYCAWLSTKTKRRVRLPSTEEWQAAARGADGRAYPWGNGFDGTRCNYSGTMLGRTEDVAVFESGDSPTGCRQMVGNAFEWATTAEGRCLFHGGSYNSAAEVYGLTFLAMESTPDYKNDQLGFRIVIEG